MRIGIISDTHGLLRPEAIAALSGVDHILHAGDIGNADFLDTLGTIAPVTAIRGNIDQYGPCADLPPTEAIELGGKLFYLVHSVHDLDIDPAAAGVAMVVSGHSHKASMEHHRGVLYFNPGSAGPRRFSLPVTLGIVTLTHGKLHSEIVHLLA